MFKTIKANYSAEIVEKKSKFIANLFYVESIEDAEEKIKEIKKKYFDARHNCFAYRVATKDGITERFSDDGEPSGTAGGPMLTTLSGQNIANVLVIVTRYFGGILLGTGGLIRAYTSAVQETIGKAEFVTKDMGIRIELETSYSDLEKLKYYCKNQQISICNVEYLQNIQIQLELTEKKYCQLIKTKNELNFEINNIKKIEEKYITIDNIV